MDTTEDREAWVAERNERDKAAAVATETVAGRLRTLMAGNRDYLALTAPTAAETRKQVDKITRQVNALIRLALSDLDNIDEETPDG